MAALTFTPPKQWEDWSDWLLGFWVILSPWALYFDREPTAMGNAVIVGVLIVLSEGVTLTWFRPWEEWVNVALGLWLAISPAVLGIAHPAAIANFVIVGIVVAGLALYEVWQVTARPGRRKL